MIARKRKTQAGLVAVILAIGAIAGGYEPAFLTVANVINIATQLTVVAPIAIGMTFVIVAGGIDLSVGATVAIAAVSLGLLAENGANVWLAAATAVALGACIGAVNGTLVTKLGLAPFLATLSMMGIARGSAFLLSGGQPISGVSGDLTALYSTRLANIPLSVILAAAIAVASVILLSLSAGGRRIYASGSNERAARLAGIDVEAHRFLTYVIVGACAGISGVLLTARLDSAQPLAGSLYELDAIAAVVIGGGTLNGGRGDVMSTLLGAILVLEVRNAVTIMGLPTHAQPLVIGLVLLAAVARDALRK